MLHLALIDCGDVAEHYAAIASRLTNARFTATVDADAKKSRQTADALEASISRDTLDELLAQHADAFDAVLIHSRADLHENHCIQAARAGKHVLVDSPIAPTVETADAIIDACRQAGVQLMVAQASRFLPSVQEVKTNLDSGKLGAFGLLRIHRWESLKNDCPLLDRVTREIDLAIWFNGQLPSEVYATGRSISGSPSDRDNYLQIHLGFPGGAMALIDYTCRLPSGDDYFSLSAIASTGAAYADDHRNVQLLYRGGDPAALKTGQGAGHVLAQLQEFTGAIAENREPSITGADGRAALQVAAAVAQSASQSRAVHLQGAGYELV